MSAGPDLEPWRARARTAPIDVVVQEGAVPAGLVLQRHRSRRRLRSRRGRRRWCCGRLRAASPGMQCHEEVNAHRKPCGSSGCRPMQKGCDVVALQESARRR